MVGNYQKADLVLSGGGVKGIAFIGAFEAAEKRGWKFENIAGVSSGALAGSFLGAGYRADELLEIMDKFDFGKIKVSDIPKKVPAVARYIEFCKTRAAYRQKSIEYFLNQQPEDTEDFREESELQNYRSNIIKNAVNFSRERALFDGDYLEEWVSRTLMKRGIRTFGDLKYGVSDKANPGGYKVRMTAVDANRFKVIVLPDDIAYYGIDPDRFEVAKAVRMSTSVPFAFKPVEIKKQTGNHTKTYHIVDGGVLDGMPSWLVDNSKGKTVIGLRLISEKKMFSLDTPLNILKGLISVIHNTGVPKNIVKIENMANIDTSGISFLDFNLNDREKVYLYRMGKYHANLLFNKMNSRYLGWNIFNILFSRLFGRQ